MVIDIWAHPSLVSFHSEKDTFPPPGQRTFWYMGPPVTCSFWDLTLFSHSAIESFLKLSHPSISHPFFSFPHRQKSGKHLPFGFAPLWTQPIQAGVCLWEGCLAQGRDLPGGFAAEGSCFPQPLPSLRSPVASILPHPTDTSVLIFLDSLLLVTLWTTSSFLQLSFLLASFISQIYQQLFLEHLLCAGLWDIP